MLLPFPAEHEQLLELQRKEQEEEQQRKDEQRRHAEAEMALALQEVQKAELEAATMAAKQVSTHPLIQQLIYSPASLYIR